MKETLYTIPVTDAFQADCECPLCKMKQELEENAISYTLGPSYMEDDNRAQTDQLGFCEQHIQVLYGEKNRLGLALILSTHMAKTTKDLKALSENKVKPRSLFKKTDMPPVSDYIESLNHTCFICQRVEQTFLRYIDTILHLYKTNPAFADSLRQCKGFCTRHYGLLHAQAAKTLSGTVYDTFVTDLDRVYFDNMERMQAELEWFIQKFDYRFRDEPWKNSKDALPRSVLKTHSTYTEVD